MSIGMSRALASIDEAEAILGEPFCRGQGFAIFHGDCAGAMRQLPAEIIDLTITSPPYNIGKEYETSLALDEYLNWCKQWLAEIHRLTCFDGALWLNLGHIPLAGRAKALPLPYLLWGVTGGPANWVVLGITRPARLERSLR